ncbi:MAG: hypothetical protein H6990_06085 [Pseudomonadales bacterium]|nr:hypothetical protein [Pseudomonadales bacterium]
MNEITFPEWLEAEAVRYIAAFYNGEPQIEKDGNRKGDRSFVFHYDEPNQYLVSSELKKIWLKAKKRFPENTAKGQIELFRMIEFSLRQKEDNWKTERQAERWRERMLETIEKLERLWGEIPSNFMTPVDDSQDMFRADETNDYLPGIQDIKVFIDGLEYSQLLHGRQSEGQKAEKRHFMRELSSEFKAATGKWRRPEVAAIASTIFGVSVQPQDVTRATEGLVDTSIEDDEFMRTLLMDESAIPPQK